MKVASQRARTHFAYVASLWPELPPALVTTGDIVAVKGAMDLALGVVTGTHIRLMTPTGLSALPLVATDPDSGEIRPVILRAWRACGCM